MIPVLARDDPDPNALKDAVDEQNRVPVLVDDAEVRGVRPAVELAIARRLVRLLRVEQRATLRA